MEKREPMTQTLRHCTDCGKPIRANAFSHRKPENKLVLLCQKCRLKKLTGEKNPNWKGDKAGYRAKQYRKTGAKPHVKGKLHF
jgi:DNA-directed RNA polymerase subunit RPC12/RpoP